MSWRAARLLGRSSSHDPLHSAVLHDDIIALESLIAQGNDIDRRSRRGSTGLPRILFIVSGQGETWGSGDTPIHVAAFQGRPAALRLLLEAGADPSIKNDFGETPLDCAKLIGNSECVKLLSGPER